MDHEATLRSIVDTLGAVDVLEAMGGWFFFHDPRDGQPVDHKLPFATMAASDAFDDVSDLNRPGVFRLNIGVKRETFRTLFGGDGEGDHDFTEIDRILPHPVYAAQSWVCVVNPGPRTLATVQTLLAEAYDIAAARSDRRARRG